MVEGLKLSPPAGASALTRERMAHLHPDAAKWQLYELESREDNLKEIEVSDRGNVRTRLVHWTDEAQARERFAETIDRVRELMPEAEMAVISPAEMVPAAMDWNSPGHAWRTNRVRYAQQRRSCSGWVWTKECSWSRPDAFRHLVHSIGEVRHTEGPRDHALWRLHPERWLESLVVQDVAEVDERLDAACLYSQVPAFSTSDRAMIDVLTTTYTGRLAVVELKADEDIHLPLQGLDYWSRVAWHHARGEFQRFGYFPRRRVVGRAALVISGGAGVARASR